MILNPLIIAGKKRAAGLASAGSIFYPGYSYQFASAGELDAAAAIGAARRAERLTLAQRRSALEQAASLFRFTEEELQHTVRMTGMPTALVEDLIADIPRILREIPQSQARRFTHFSTAGQEFAENIDERSDKVFHPREGFCYAITPGNDPRAAAIVAANLCWLGIPFIIRASVRDAIAPPLIQALIGAGFDPRACNLVYLNRHDPLSAKVHFQLLAASQIVWTFGPPQEIDQTLRYRAAGERVQLNLSGLGYNPDDLDKMANTIASLPLEELRMRLCADVQQEDHFQGKLVLRHAAGNCASILYPPWTSGLAENLYPSLGYPLACTATRSVMAVGEADWAATFADFLASLPVGDPLDPSTRIGYIDPKVLDEIENQVQANRMKITTYGGERISPVQAKPRLVTSQEDAPDFFTRDLPAYVLALRTCRDIQEAVEQIHCFTGEIPRLAVSLFHAPRAEQDWAIANLRATSLLVNVPTSHLTPYLHEGNDYALLLSDPKLVIKRNPL